jgi:hypothetical protein
MAGNRRCEGCGKEYWFPNGQWQHKNCVTKEKETVEEAKTTEEKTPVVKPTAQPQVAEPPVGQLSSMKKPSSMDGWVSKRKVVPPDQRKEYRKNYIREYMRKYRAKNHPQ